MARLVVATLMILGGALQLWAAFAASRAEGQLRTQQGRQLEAMLGRRGTVAFFVVVGLGLALGGFALGAPALMAP